ncbi:MAG: hypothetical protein GC191_05895 [Azospirillum sp.]|nr:hypothetical protein [Azospirillum sp.]
MGEPFAISFGDNVTAILLRAPAITLEELTAGLTEASAQLERELKEPAGPTPSAHGALRQSIGALPVSLSGTVVSAGVGTASLYAVPVELGTRPHMPPIAPILDWVEEMIKEGKIKVEDGRGDKGKKKASAEAAALSIAEKIRWKIAHHGTAGAHMFSKVFLAQERQVRRILEGAVAKAVARIRAGDGT